MINLPNIKKEFEIPTIDGKYVIDIPSIELKPGTILLLRGEASTSRNIYLQIISKNIVPDSGIIPEMDIASKCKIFFINNPEKIKNSELQLSCIGKCFLEKKNSIYI